MTVAAVRVWVKDLDNTEALEDLKRNGALVKAEIEKISCQVNDDAIMLQMEKQHHLDWQSLIKKT